MDVGSPLVNRVEHHLVDEAHDRRVVGFRLLDIVAGDFVARGDIERLEVGIAQVPECGCFLRLHRFVEDAFELALLDQHRFRVDSGVELDLVQRLQVGRVGDADIESIGAPEQRQGAVTEQELVTDQIHR